MFQKYFQHMPNGHILKTLARFDHIVNVFSMILKFFIVITIQLFGHMSGTHVRNISGTTLEIFEMLSCEHMLGKWQSNI